jgi:hypothetical protein
MPQLLIPGERHTLPVEYEAGLPPDRVFMLWTRDKSLILLRLELQSLGCSAHSLDTTDCAVSAALADLLWDGVKLLMFPSVENYFALFIYIYCIKMFKDL